MQGSPNKPLAGVAALAPAYISLVAFRKERQLEVSSALSRWGHSFSFEPDSGPMIVSRPQSPKGALSFCKLRPIATPVRRNDEMRKDPPRPFDCRSNCQPDSQTAQQTTTVPRTRQLDS